LLHGNSGLLLKIALLGRKDVIVANVRYYLHQTEEKPPIDALEEESATENYHDGNNGRKS